MKKLTNWLMSTIQGNRADMRANAVGILLVLAMVLS